YHDHLSLFKHQLSFYLHYAAPRTIGGALPGENTLLTTIHTLTLGLGLFCLCASCLLFLLSLFWHHPQLLRIRQLVALPLLYAVCVSIAFCTSIIATAGLISLQHDIAGRYAAPIMLVLRFNRLRALQRQRITMRLLPTCNRNMFITRGLSPGLATRLFSRPMQV